MLRPDKYTDVSPKKKLAPDILIGFPKEILIKPSLSLINDKQ